MGRFDLDSLIRRLSPVDATSVSNMAAARRQIATAEFDRTTGEVLAKGRSGTEPSWFNDFLRESTERQRRIALEVGREAMANDGVNGMYHRFVAAYPKDTPSTRRHELFHGLVGQARLSRDIGHPSQVSPLIELLAAGGKYPQRSFRGGAFRIAEEIAAHGAGRRRPLSWREAARVAGDYAPGYQDDGGLLHALPAYAVSVSPHLPAAAAILAAGGLGLAASQAGEE